MDAISVSQLVAARASASPPLVIDVRRKAAYTADSALIAGALRRDPEAAHEWAGALAYAKNVVVYCVHGHEVSQGVAAALRERGFDAAYLEGGMDAWKTAAQPLMPKPAGASTRWVTRERPKIDRIACPWLIARFIDADAQFVYVPASEVRDSARALAAIPYDVPDVAYSHVGERCSFDAFLRIHAITEPALCELAHIVRGADTARLDLAPQCAGLLAVSLGLSHLHADDQEMLKRGMDLYDGLYAWCCTGQGEFSNTPSASLSPTQ